MKKQSRHYRPIPFDHVLRINMAEMCVKPPGPVEFIAEILPTPWKNEVYI